MIVNAKKRHLLWAGLVVLSLVILGFAVVRFVNGGSIPMGVGSPTWATDMSDDKKLAGIVGNIWFGQVIEETGKLENKEDVPATYYEISVLENLKGNLSGKVPVEQQGVDFADGTKFRITGDAELLEPGHSYLFATSLDDITGYHVIVSGYGNLLLDVAKETDKETVLQSDDAKELRTRFQHAIQNQEAPPY